VQVTAQSLSGKFGEAAQEMAELWLDSGAVHFLASDAHNLNSRPLRLKETFNRVAETRGEDLARALLLDNPLAAFLGRPLPWLPDLPDDSDPNGAAGRKRKRFWFF
jgi:protein-tyrosine phosphatase